MSVGLQELAPKGPVPEAALGVEDQGGVLADLVVREIVVINEDDDQVGGLELRSVAADAREWRRQIGILRDMGVVHSHVRTEGVQLPSDDHRR